MDREILAILRGLILMIANYIFLTCTVPVVEIEGFVATLARIRLVNQYDPQSTLSNSTIALFKN